MAAPSYTTGYPAKSVYRTPLSSEGQEMIWSSGAKARFLGGSQGIIEAGSTFQVSGKIEVKTGGEIELEAGSTMNVESGAVIRFSARAAIKNSPVVTYTCSTATLNPWDRFARIGSSNSFIWKLPKPQSSCVGIEKFILFASPKGTTHNVVLGVTTKGCNFGSTSKHSLTARATGAGLGSTIAAGKNVGAIWAHLLAVSTATWAVLSPLSTDIKVGKLMVTSATGGIA